MSRTLSTALISWLNGTNAPGHPIVKQEWRDELLLGDELQAVVNLDGTAVGQGSDLIGVYDSGSVFTATTLSGVLAELYMAATTASSDTFTDTNSFYALDQVGPAFVALGVALGGTSSTVRNYTGGTGTKLIDNDSYFTALDKLDLGFVDLLAVTVGKGATTVGIYDVATYYAGATVEAALVELAVAIGGASSTVRNYTSNTVVADNDTVLAAVSALDARVGAYQDQLVTVAVAVAGAVGGATDDPSANIQVKRAHDNSTPVATLCEVMIFASPVQYAPRGAPVATVTFSAATVGSIIASGNGWALVLTNATGAFACTISDSADETIYFRAITADAISDLGHRCTVVASNEDAATWAA